MPAPLAKGLIIAASVLVAAGIAIYESPQVRQWVDQSRRKIAVALHSLGDEIQPRRSSEGEQEFEERKRRREDLIRRNRNELIRKARAEGVAVDLDELAKVGEQVEMAERRQRASTNGSYRSFDDMLNSEGRLKKDEDAQTQIATGHDTANKGARRRGVAAGATASNPFADEHQVLFDHDANKAPSPPPSYIEKPPTQSRESTATVDGKAMSSAPLIDLAPEPATTPLQPENPQTASIPQSEADDAEPAAQSFYSDAEPAAQSFYSFTSSHSHPQVLSIASNATDSDIENMSAGTLTPRSEASAFTGASVVGSHADDIAIMSMQSDDDARSEAFSETGFTDAGFSEVGSEAHLGVMTPSSWTDVGSDDGSEWGAPAQASQVQQPPQQM
ncbi:hypothetical protein EJ04DRAFT_303888 [Polyplosphaeria fusca]|uniref:Uncharacterized protein n=1 Tax=Polyplosphaeria fusca TaxID=682080 RepID=A0A9P4QXE7_9PLEO|nr:hypothetical protein EJ04DRAFT_303888 [Polyplosphaeria fusca]